MKKLFLMLILPLFFSCNQSSKNNNDKANTTNNPCVVYIGEWDKIKSDIIKITSNGANYLVNRSIPNINYNYQVSGVCENGILKLTDGTSLTYVQDGGYILSSVYGKYTKK